MFRLTRIFLVLLTTNCCVSGLSAEIGAITEQYGACGENCLFEVAMLLKKEVSYNRIRDYVDPSGTRETDLAKIEGAATCIGLAPVGLELQHRDVGLLRAPAILQLRGVTPGREQGHFVVYLGRTKEGEVCLLDPPRLPSLVSSDALRSRWTGYGLVVCSTQEEANDYKRFINAAIRPFWAEPFVWSAVGLMTLLVSLAMRRMRGGQVLPTTLR